MSVQPQPQPQTQPQQQKRGRKPRGGIANLDELLSSPNVVQRNVQPLVPSSSFSVYEELPWNAKEHVSASVHNGVPVDFTDEQVDNMDMFPDAELTDYEVLFKTQTTSSIHRTATSNLKGTNCPTEMYRPMAADNAENNHSNHAHGGGSVPEHMRIIRLPSSQQDATTVQLQQSQSQQPQQLQENVFPEFYHPLRIKYMSSEALNEPFHVFEDNNAWPQTSPIACWWCCHTFTEYPKVVPLSINGSNIQVTGNFCSWNCAKAYAIKRFRSLAHFHTFYDILFKESSVHVRASPSPLCLRHFGGPMGIEEYRRTFSNESRRVSFDSLSHVNIMVAKTFISDNARM
jgi:hypothetical protein